MSHFATDDEAMGRALALARLGRGFVEPNPAVGAVVVSPDGMMLGEGYHERFGGPHAEVQAIAQAGTGCRGGTLYCTLEPCSHFGKTPPCAPLVVAAGFRRVVVAMSDPAPHVAGRGLALLREAGIEVTLGVCETEARRLVAPFVTLMTQGRPYVHAKWAMSLDGRIATRTGHSQWISNERSRERVHELRGRMDAILVGRGTVRADDPLLTARPPGPRTALRIVLDSRLEIALDSQLVSTAGDVPVLIATTAQADGEKIETLRSRGVEVAVLEAETTASPARVSPSSLMTLLGQRQMTNLLVEGGGEVLGAFADADLIDEYHVFLAPKRIGGARAASPIGGLGLESVPTLPNVRLLEAEVLDEDVYLNGVAVRI